MDFVSIDFETANEKRNSACSLGITVVENNKIVEEKYWLIKPYEMRFKPMNVWIHGIVEGDVENEPRMDELWDEIRPYLENKFVIAHNASFDVSVLRNTLDCYNIPYPEFDYACTVVMAKTFYPHLRNHKLNTVAKYLGVEFKHHHASEDATAAAEILLDIIKELNIETVNELSRELDLKIGRLYPGGYKAAGALKKKGNKKTKAKPKAVRLENLNPPIGKVKCNNLFSNKTVVFTGPLSSYKRSEAMRKVVEVGGKVGSSVTRKTNYLVTGICNIDKLPYDKKSNKLKKAEELIKRGQDIKIISEEKFLEVING